MCIKAPLLRGCVFFVDIFRYARLPDPYIHAFVCFCCLFVWVCVFGFGDDWGMLLRVAK